MGKIIGYTLSAIGIALLAIIAMPLALAAGIVLLILACIGAGSGLAVLAVLFIFGAVFCAIVLHLLLPLAIPVLLVCGIVYLVKSFTGKKVA